MLLNLMAAAAAVASLPCHEDEQCVIYQQEGWRCLFDANASLPDANCHLPGPGMVGNSTCSCQEDACGAYANVVPPAEGWTKYLMIGDSVSMGMHADLAADLKPHEWWLLHVPGNAASANFGSHCLSTWLDVPGMNISEFDVISFNFGLHDIGYDVERITEEQYTNQLLNITNTLSGLRAKYGAKLLWVNTTPVPTVPVYDAGGPCNVTSKCLNPPRYDSDVRLYNSAAAKIMEEADIPILDLYSYVIEQCGGKIGYKNCTGFQLPANVHYTAAGWQGLSQQMLTALLSL